MLITDLLRRGQKADRSIGEMNSFQALAQAMLMQTA